MVLYVRICSCKLGCSQPPQVTKAQTLPLCCEGWKRRQRGSRDLYTNLAEVRAGVAVPLFLPA